MKGWLPLVAAAVVLVLMAGAFLSLTIDTNARLDRLQSSVSSLQSELAARTQVASGGSVVLLRTWGAALASFVTGSDGLTYLRLTETGNSSGVESSLASHPFDATVTGASVEWSAVANDIATDRYHVFFPLVLEDAPNGGSAIEFEQRLGIQEVATMVGRHRTTAFVHWDPTVPHVFKIVVVAPGQAVRFYIDGKVVQTIDRTVPNATFMHAAAEVYGIDGASLLPATLDVYGGALG